MDTDLLYKSGEVISFKGNQTVYWDKPQFVWYVLNGEVNLFTSTANDDILLGKRAYLLTIKPGQIIVGLENEEDLPFRLQMNGVENTELIQMDYQLFQEKCLNGHPFQLLVDEWEHQLLKWMHSVNIQNNIHHHFDRKKFLRTIHSFLQQSTIKEAERLKRLSKIDQNKMDQSIYNLMSTMKMKEEADKKVMDTDDLLVRTCRLVGKSSGILIKSPLLNNDHVKVDESRIKQIAKASKIRFRQTTLNGAWWKQDNGSLLAYHKEDHRPVALILKKSNQYELHDLATPTVQRVTKEIDQVLERRAYMFYRPLPNRKLNLWDLFTYTSKMSNVKKDFAAVFLFGLLGGLLSLSLPLGLGKLVDSIIPAAERGRMIDFVFILIAIAIASFTFQIIRSIAMLRVEGRMDAHVQAAVWDRILNLPVPFFRQFSSGDLAMRTNSINSIRKMLSGTTLSTIFSGIFSSTQFFLLFYYSSKLAWIATVLVAIAIGVAVLSSYIMLRNQRKLEEINGKLAGLVFQIIEGIAKFRVSGAERRAFGLWSDHFSASRKISFRTGMITNYFEIFNNIFPVVVTIILFLSVSLLEPNISRGSFLAFHSAFTGFITSMTSMSLALISVINIIPMYERAKPILEELPEIDEEKQEAGKLTGAIEVSHVDFRYDDEGSLILKDVSIKINPGEFVAIVGTSGSGKSTLMRILLGFDRPLAGSVFFDNQNIENLDIQSVRSQLGVVLQGGQILAGDIYTNIIGATNLTIEDAWVASRMAGFDNDIKSMPMGMFTFVDDGARTLSGGQRQRLLIASALVHKPNIIFFDEATSALDNQTQKIVSDSIESLNATRVVIAHRLSTIMNADRIFVLDKGQIVEEGTFQELMGQSGLFSELAKRQMA